MAGGPGRDLRVSVGRGGAPKAGHPGLSDSPGMG